MKIVPLQSIDNREKVCEMLEKAIKWVRSPETDTLPNLSCYVILFEEHTDRVDHMAGVAYFYKDFHYVNSVFGTVGALEVAKNEMLRGDE